MKNIRTDERFSALCLFRAYRKTLGARAAYWLAVYRHGWANWNGYAESQLSFLLRPKFGHRWATLIRYI